MHRASRMSFLISKSPIPQSSITSNQADNHLNSNKASDRLDLKQYMDRNTANSSFQRSLDILFTFNIQHEQFESHESSTEPFKESEVVNGLQVHHAGKNNNYNFMYEDTDYSAKILSKILQRQEEIKDRDFLRFKNKSVILKSSKT